MESCADFHPRNVEFNYAATARHGLGGGFQHADDAETGFAVGLRPSRVVNAINEMRRFGLERFGNLNLRRPHVAGAIAREHLMLGSRLIVEAQTLVVDLD